MNNQMILRAMYDSAIKMDENELYHHGVEGMSWGDRNGPPYPLSGANKKEARAEAKAKIEREKRLEKMRKAAAKKRKAEAKEQKKQAKIDKMKQELYRKGDMNKINKKAKYFTDEELELARERARQMTETRYTKSAKDAPDPNAMSKVMKLAQLVQTVAPAAISALSVAKGISELKKSRLDMDLAEMRAQDDSIDKKVKLLKDFNPEAAAEMASEFLGVKVEYKPKKEEKKPQDIKTISEALMKVNPEAAAQYLKDQTGYGGNVAAGSLAKNPAYKGSKNVKGTLSSILTSSTKTIPVSSIPHASTLHSKIPTSSKKKK